MTGGFSHQLQEALDCQQLQVTEEAGNMQPHTSTWRGIELRGLERQPWCSEALG